jgi:hypothetical protein
MSIKSLYRDYFQKSRVFLYPALDIKRGVSVTPVQTYVAWSDRFKPEDRKFICLYNMRKDDEFIRHEKTKLVGNRLFHDFVELSDDQGIYIFDYQEFAEDWDAFVQGKYSQMKASYKRKIKNFYGSYSSNFAYVESFLHPEKYFSLYSELLGVDVEHLKQVGELCSKPDMVEETLLIEANDKILKTNNS